MTEESRVRRDQCMGKAGLDVPDVGQSQVRRDKHKDRAGLDVIEALGLSRVRHGRAHTLCG